MIFGSQFSLLLVVVYSGTSALNLKELGTARLLHRDVQDTMSCVSVLQIVIKNTNGGM